MGKLAFLFAGQGAQAVGMGRELYDSFESARRLFDMAETRRKGIRALCFEGPTDALNLTINAQPCLFLIDMACVKALNESGISADGTAGFSLGEIPAACHAGLMDDVQAFDFVCRRAEVMQACAKAEKGTMLAVLKLTAGDVEELCAGIEHAWPANYNCPGQTVVACACEAAAAVRDAVAGRGGKTVELPVNGAFHSPHMNAASEAIADYLKNERLTAMSIPLYANVTARIYENAGALLAKQVNSPVLWQKTIENMVADGYDTFIEVGPGRTLSGFVKKINGQVNVYNVCDLDSLEKTVKEAANA